MATYEPQTGAGVAERPFYASGPRVLTLTYQSRIAAAQSAEEFGELLKQARSRNRSAGVTGMLLFGDDRFFQWLEGPEREVQDIWRSIQDDARHTDVEMLNREFTRHRLFSDWDMRLVSSDAMLEAVCHQTKARRSLPRKLVEMSARFALDGEADALRRGIEDVLSMGVELASLYSGLIEPVTHLLGDWWGQDLCTEREIALALSGLRSVLREVARHDRREPAPGEPPLRVLLVAPPDEPHMLGVSLASDLYHQAGYDVVVEFPQSHEEVGRILGSQWFDVMTMSLSDVFSRFDRVESFASIIASARRQSRNRDIVIVAGGRAFSERPGLAASLTADAVYPSVADLVKATRDGLDARAKARSN